MQAVLTVDLKAICDNWRALDALSTGETGAVVKADAYGLGMAQVAPALQAAGARSFFVAQAEEAVALRQVLGDRARIFNLSGYMRGDDQAFERFGVVPVLNSATQVRGFAKKHKGLPCAAQVDTGMNRLGMEALEFASVGLDLMALQPEMVMSHLACADDPAHLMNGAQLAAFITMTAAMPTIKKSFAATGGILLGAPYHFDLTRAGIGMYGGEPFKDARPVVTLDLPVIQARDVLPGEAVGYGAAWIATKPHKIATVSAGYADGIIRSAKGFSLYAGGVACPVVGRISMDLITVDVTGLDVVPDSLSLLNDVQTVDRLANTAGTIGYEILTSLGARYKRVYTGSA